MDTYIAAEDVIQITASVDIMNEKEFEGELLRLGSPVAKADAIRTRISKRIIQKWDENPSYYKKFSECIEEIINEYREKKISDADYLERMHTVMEDFRKGYSGKTYPEKIKHNVNAQSFYGVVKEFIQDEGLYQTNSDIVHEFQPIYNIEDILSNVVLDVDKIIDKHSKVDWHENDDVHKSIRYDLFDVLYQMCKENFPNAFLNLIDMLTENIMRVALRRY